jgi:hypothetical protein
MSSVPSNAPGKSLQIFLSIVDSTFVPILAILSCVALPDELLSSTVVSVHGI